VRTSVTNAERDAIGDVRIWPTRVGQQMVSAKMSRYAASVISRIPVGWTMCGVRPRPLFQNNVSGAKYSGIMPEIVLIQTRWVSAGDSVLLGMYACNDQCC